MAKALPESGEVNLLQPERAMNGLVRPAAGALELCAADGQRSRMSLRIATFNVENLMNRFDFSGFRNELLRDRTLSLYQIEDEAQYRHMEQARLLSLTDDTRQLSALAIAETRADILCLQEVDNIESLRAFEYGYLYKMIGEGYRQKLTTAGNDSRGIDVAVLMREQTRDGQPIDFVRMTSHAALTYEEAGIFNEDLAALGLQPNERVFRRDCLEVDLRVAGKPFTLYVVHFKSMGGPRDGRPGREVTMPVRDAEARATRHIIEQRFGKDHATQKRWAICGDFNDYRERVLVGGDGQSGYSFDVVREARSSLDGLLDDGFCENVVERLPELERWTLYHTRGPQERHLCQLDYILLSSGLAHHNGLAKPEIVRGGQPFRTVFPPGQEVQRYPRTGWDRPKASDHCPVAITLDIV
jgi:predicted extracellular nuclease